MLGRGKITQRLLEQEQERRPIGRARVSQQTAQAGPPPLVKPNIGRGAVAQNVQRASGPIGIGRGMFKDKENVAPLERATFSPPPLSSPNRGSTASADKEVEQITKQMEDLNQNANENLPARPDYGKAGKMQKVVTNFIKVGFPESEVYQYHVSYDPPVDSRFIRYKLLEEHLAEVRAWRFDGSILYTGTSLPANNQYKSTQESTGEVVTIACMFTKNTTIEKCIPLLNIIFRAVLGKLKYTRLGKNLYDPSRAVQIPKHKLELWPGYVTSVSCQDGGFMLQTNVSHKMLRTDTVMDMLVELFRTNQHEFQSEATKQIVGNVVMTRYNNKTYRVDDIQWDSNPQSTFTDRRGGEVAYVDYYKNQYGIVIRDCSQPLLVHRMRPKRGAPIEEERIVYLVPELCAMTGLSQSTFDDFAVRKDIVAHTRLDPRDRVKALRGFIENVYSSPEAVNELKKWDLSIDRETLKVDARVLEPETIIFGGNDPRHGMRAGDKADFSNATGQKPPITPVNLNNWVIIYYQKDNQRAQDLIASMKSQARKLGMQIAVPVALPLRDDKTATYIRAISDNMTSDVQLVVTIVPTDRDDRYNAIKQLCYIDKPVASQVIKSKTLGNPNRLRAIVQKIMLQIIAKLGGELWSCDIPLKNCMIVGIDTYHDPTSRASSSVTGFVASMNQLCTQYFSASRQEDPGQEFGSSLGNLMTSALKEYREKNNMLPDRIIVFRDGTSEGQFNMVKQYELTQFMEVFGHLEGDYNPELVVVVVQKRIRTRMFCSEGDEKRGAIFNAPPGTVIDHTITSDTLYDFYLVSQHVGKGTVTPSHYVVVHDTSTLKPDHIQKLAYKLTHTYWNWPGTVRVPAPCLYAHKIAYMHGQHLHRAPNVALRDRLFYL